MNTNELKSALKQLRRACKDLENQLEALEKEESLPEAPKDWDEAWTSFTTGQVDDYLSDL